MSASVSGTTNPRFSLSLAPSLSSSLSQKSIEKTVMMLVPEADGSVIILNAIMNEKMMTFLSKHQLDMKVGGCQQEVAR